MRFHSMRWRRSRSERRSKLEVRRSRPNRRTRLSNSLSKGGNRRSTAQRIGPRAFHVGPMTDDGPWNLAAGRAREKQRRIVCGPSGTDRDALAADYQRTFNMGGVPPGSIVRPRG